MGGGGGAEQGGANSQCAPSFHFNCFYLYTAFSKPTLALKGEDQRLEIIMKQYLISAIETDGSEGDINVGLRGLSPPQNISNKKKRNHQSLL